MEKFKLVVEKEEDSDIEKHAGNPFANNGRLQKFI